MFNRFLILAFFLLFCIYQIACACDEQSPDFIFAMKNGCQSIIDGIGGTAGNERCCYFIKQTNCVAELSQFVGSKVTTFECN